MTQDEALTVLKTGANVFLTGEPGSGKTHTVNAYVKWLKEHGIEPAITASTGIAATHIGGLTIHSWSGIGIKRTLDEQDLDKIAQNERIAKRVLATQILIIDEVSMLGGETLLMVDAVCREIRKDHRPFGGMQVVLVGDFFQLPPVSKESEWERQKSGNLWEEARPGRFAFSGEAWARLDPLVCYLSEQHRQEDATFLAILTAIRHGEVSDDHREALASRAASGVARTGIPRLFSHNAHVDRVNDDELGKITTMARTYQMRREGSERVIETLVKGCLSPEVLTLKVGARVMCTKNNFAERFVNGTLGTVTGFDEASGYPRITTLGGATLVVEPMTWGIEEGGRMVASITQVPLRLAWAMTIHKSQGMSLDAAHMDLTQTFEYGQGYVALSRVRTLEGLVLDGMNERALEVDPEVATRDIDFRERSDETTAAFAELKPDELRQMHENFIKSCGGTLNTVKKVTKHAKGMRKKAIVAATLVLTLLPISPVHAEEPADGSASSMGAVPAPAVSEARATTSDAGLPANEVATATPGAALPRPASTPTPTSTPEENLQVVDKPAPLPTPTEPSGATSMLVVIGVALASLIGAYGLAKAMQGSKSKKGIDRCAPIKAALAAEKSALQALEAQFSLQQSAVEMLKKKIEDMVNDKLYAAEDSIVEGAGKVHETVDTIKERYEQAAGAYEKLKALREASRTKVKTLEQSYATCMSTPGAASAPGTGIAVAIPTGGKLLRFEQALVPLVLKGERTFTQELADESDAEEGDEVDCVNIDTDEKFCKVVVTKVENQHPHKIITFKLK